MGCLHGSEESKAEVAEGAEGYGAANGLGEFETDAEQACALQS